MNLLIFRERKQHDEIAEHTSLQGKKKEILDKIKQDDSYFLPHIGLKKNTGLRSNKLFVNF